MALAASALLIAFVVFLVKLGPEWLASPDGLLPADKAEERGRVRTALLALLAGALAAVGAIYTGRTFALNRRGQITERFTRAIDQLGHETVDVRLGGIYALERIAHESREEHGPIMEVLTAYVRERSPWPPKPAPAMPTEASVDVKAVMAVLARRNVEHERDGQIQWDLSRTDLRGIRAAGLQLENARLVGAQLQRASLYAAQLHRADLTDSDLPNADLSHAEFPGAELTHASLAGAHLLGADLKGANLTDANLTGANLTAARLQHATLEDAQLNRALLNHTNLQRANLLRAQFKDAALTHAQLQSALLRDAQLQGANLNGAELDSVSYNDGTRWPEGFKPPT